MNGRHTPASRERGETLCDLLHLLEGRAASGGPLEADEVWRRPAREAIGSYLTGSERRDRAVYGGVPNLAGVILSRAGGVESASQGARRTNGRDPITEGEAMVLQGRVTGECFGSWRRSWRRINVFKEVTKREGGRLLVPRGRKLWCKKKLWRAPVVRGGSACF